MDIFEKPAATPEAAANPKPAATSPPAAAPAGR
jgi:hypothetical protein